MIILFGLKGRVGMWTQGATQRNVKAEKLKMSNKGKAQNNKLSKFDLIKMQKSTEHYK